MACTIGAVVFAVLCVVAFVLPANTTIAVRQPYTQTLRFSYRASVPPSAVYPSGTVSTGDPVYIQLVHLLTVTAAYRLTTTAPNRLHGTIGIRGTLSNSSGWSRSFWLAKPAPFAGVSAHSTAQVNLTRVESLADRISAQIGTASTSGYVLVVTPAVKDRREDRGPADVRRLQPDAEPRARRAAAAGRRVGDRHRRVEHRLAQASLVHSTPGAATIDPQLDPHDRRGAGRRQSAGSLLWLLRSVAWVRSSPTSAIAIARRIPRSGSKAATSI